MGSDDNYVVFEVHYNGTLYRVPRTRYIGGDIDITNAVDPDELSFFAMERICSKYGYVREFDMMYYRKPDIDLDNGLIMFNDDNEVIDMLSCHQGFPLITIYVVRGKPSQQSQVTQYTPTTNSNEEETLGYEAEAEDADGYEAEAEGADGYEDDFDELDVEAEGADCNEGEVNDVDGFDVVIQEDYIYGYDSDLQKENPEERRFWKKVISSDDDLFDVAVKKGDAGKNIHGEERGNKGSCGVIEEVSGKDLESDFGDSDELYSPKSDSFEDMNPTKIKRYDEFVESRDMEKVQITNGMKFADVRVFRKAIREYNVLIGKDLKWVKNDPDRVLVICKSDNCGYRVYGSLITGEMTFQVKSMNSKHSCTRAYRNSQVTAQWLATKYLVKVRNDPQWKVSAMEADIRTTYKIDVSRHMVCRAKNRCLKIIYGNYKESYTRIWDYCETLLHHNKGSSVKLHVERPLPNKPAIFQRLYVSFNAMKKGFKEGCRPLIGVDACHLKGPYGGQLISAVGRDGNDNLFPLAIASVEQENKDSWCWFLRALLNDIGNVGWTFISDRQKGLINAFEEVIPEGDHRICVRHLYANFRDKGHRGKALKDKLWAAATAYTEGEFHKAMKELKDYDKEGYNYLSKSDPTLWSRAYFSTKVKTDLLVNNLCESFNAYIMEARDKPLVAMMEIIRRKLMMRFNLKREGMEKYTGRICPKIQMKLEKNKVLSFSCVSRYAGDGYFEVDNNGTAYVISLKDKTCGCRAWDMTGIPCPHAVSAIYFDGGKPEDYVDNFYSKETYMKAYAPIIYPVPSESQWLRTDKEDVDPPVVKRAPGRPKKLRRRGADEPKNPYRIRKVGTTLKCGHCKQVGHNVRKCPHNSGANRGGSSSQTFSTTETQQMSVACSTTQGRGQGRGQVIGIGRGNQVGEGRGQVIGTGRGNQVGQGGGSGQPRGRGRGRGSGTGRGRGSGQVTGQDSGQGTRQDSGQGRGNKREKIAPVRDTTRAYYMGDEHGNVVHPTGKKRPGPWR